MRGCDGERVYFDGSNMIFMNGIPYFLGDQFSLIDVEVTTINLPINKLNFNRQQPSRSRQISSVVYKRISIPIDLMRYKSRSTIAKPIEITYCTLEEEIAFGPACYLWDYLRKSGLKGVFVPLSGGIDSCAVTLIIYSMCRLVYKDIQNLRNNVIDDCQRMFGRLPTNERDLSNLIMHTSYMGTDYSSVETKQRAANLAEAINAYHCSVDITDIVNSFINVVSTVMKRPNISNSHSENIALQNVQARSRMVLAYLFSILMPWHRSINGNLLVMSTANVDEALRGYFTKYDCSSGDLNLIGSISKLDLNRFVRYCKSEFNLPLLDDFLNAVPTAELRPLEDCQSDEKEMKMSYAELSIYGRLRKISKCGPLGMYRQLLIEWPQCSPQEIFEKVKLFFDYYGINRHKMTVLTPSYHAESYSPDDNRFDLRPFLYLGWKSFYALIEKQIKSD